MFRIVAVMCLWLIVMTGCSPSPRYTVIGGSTPSVPSPGGSSSGSQGTGQSRTTESSEPVPPPGTKIRGMASYYAEDFHDKKTANGETFNMNGLTCAHKTLPFNTWLEVTNLANRRTVIVRVNDRGPFVGDRIIDLSLGAAKELGMIEAGVQEVDIEILRLP